MSSPPRGWPASLTPRGLAAFVLAALAGGAVVAAGLTAPVAATPHSAARNDAPERFRVTAAATGVRMTIGPVTEFGAVRATTLVGAGVTGCPPDTVICAAATPALVIEAARAAAGDGDAGQHASTSGVVDADELDMDGGLRIRPAGAGAGPVTADAPATGSARGGRAELAVEPLGEVGSTDDVRPWPGGGGPAGLLDALRGQVGPAAPVLRIVAADAAAQVTAHDASTRGDASAGDATVILGPEELAAAPRGLVRIEVSGGTARVEQTDRGILASADPPTVVLEALDLTTGELDSRVVTVADGRVCEGPAPLRACVRVHEPTVVDDGRTARSPGVAVTVLSAPLETRTLRLGAAEARLEPAARRWPAAVLAALVAGAAVMALVWRRGVERRRH